MDAVSLISPFLTEEIIIEPYVRMGGGQIIYGEAETRPCRIEPAPKTKVVYKNPHGSLVETTAGALVFCEGDAIPINSRVTVKGHEMRVIQCSLMRGFGRHHLEVSLE